jgi:DNA-binding Xre family transcriptional regulator
MRVELMIRLKIKEIAEAKGINQGQLSRRADVGYSTIRRIFDDPHYSINFSTLERIGKALSVPAIELLEEVPDDQG